MPNRDTHVAVGVLIGVATALYFSRDQESDHQLAEALGGAVGGYVGGRLPDVLDPPFSPWHRSFAHGGLAVSGLGLLQLGGVRQGCRAQASQCVPGDLQAFFLHFLAGFATGVKAGYVSHLALDFRTPRGLPLLGR